MPFFVRRKRAAARLSDLDRCRSEEEICAAIPPLVRGLIETVQKESIRFYRRVHSHDMGSYGAVRDEFFFVLLAIIRWRIEGILGTDQAGRALSVLRTELSEACAGIDKTFGRERFWSAWDERCAEYCPVLLPEHLEDPDLAARALAPCFGRRLTVHLDEQAPKVMHFSAHSLRDILEEM